MTLYKNSLENPPQNIFSIELESQIHELESKGLVLVEITEEEAKEITASMPEPPPPITILDRIISGSIELPNNETSTIEIYYNSVVGTLIKKTCDEYKYDNIQSVLGWADTYPDALAIKTWATECWNILIQVEADIASSTITPMSPLELYNMMPEFIYTP